MILWGFPKMGVYPRIIHFHKILHYKPSMLGDHHVWNPHVGKNLVNTMFDGISVVEKSQNGTVMG